jgi:hypothetical protein
MAVPWGGASGRRTRRAAALLALVGAAACAALFGGGGDLKRQLVGLDARELRSCVGVPTNVDVSGDREVLQYHFNETRGKFPGVIPSSDPGVVLNPQPTGELPGRGPSGFCELSFALRGGKVEEVTVHARRSSGLNDDAACLRRAQSCRPPEARE